MTKSRHLLAPIAAKLHALGTDDGGGGDGDDDDK